MRSIIILSILFVYLIIESFALDFQIDQVNEFSITTYRGAGNRVNNIIVDFPQLYSLTSYGLEIYTIEENRSLDLLIRLPLINPTTMEKVNEYVFIGTERREYDPISAMIHKIDVSVSDNPTIVQSLELMDTVWSVSSILCVNEHLLVFPFTTSNESYYPLLNSDLEIVNENPINTPPVLVFGDNLVMSISDDGDCLIHDFSDLNDISLIGTGNISAGHDYAVNNEYAYQDTILVFNNQREVSFWNISDPDNWEMMHRIPYIENEDIIIHGNTIHIIDNLLLYLNNKSLVVMDLTDYSYSQILEIPSGTSSGIDYAYVDHNLYVTTNWSGIQRFEKENEFIYVENIGDEKGNFSVEVSSEYLFVGSGNYCIDGIAVYDITDPLNIQEINRLEGDNPLYFQIINDLLCVYRIPRQENMHIEIYNISDPLNPSLFNIIDLAPWSQPYAYILYVDQENSDCYMVIPNQRRLLKLDISMPGETILLFDIAIQSGSVLIIDDILYILTPRNSTNWYDLNIYSGLAENEPVLNNTIENFVWDPSPRLGFTGNYLTVYYADIFENINTYFFSVEDPFNPVLSFQINMTGFPNINGDLLFHGINSTFYVYYLSDDIYGIISPFTEFLNNSGADRIYFQEINGIHYIYCPSISSIGVYEYSYETAVEDDIAVPVEETYLSRNYPNPFNPETIISFYLEKEKRVKLEIFNIRGQKLATLKDDILPEGEHSLVWSPETYRGRNLPSGVYLYRLKAGDYDKTRKMLYLK